MADLELLLAAIGNLAACFVYAQYDRLSIDTLLRMEVIYNA